MHSLNKAHRCAAVFFMQNAHNPIFLILLTFYFAMPSLSVKKRQKKQSYRKRVNESDFVEQ